MANWGRGAQGAAGGAGAGAAIGSAIPGIGTAIGAGVGGLIGGIGGLFGGDDSSASDDAKANAAWLKPYWQRMLDEGPTKAAYNPNDPTQKAQMDALGRMNDLSKTGMSPQDQLALETARASAANMARGREGAIDQQMLERGGGVSSGALGSVLKAQAAQAAGDRNGMMDTAAAASAADRRAGYLHDYTAGLSNFRSQSQTNADAINNFNLKAVQGAAGQAQLGVQDAQQREYQGGQDWQNTMNGVGSLATAAKGAFGKPPLPPGSPQDASKGAFNTSPAAAPPPAAAVKRPQDDPGYNYGQSPQWGM